MDQVLLTLRVRPARLAVLINKQASPTEFIRVVRFLSQLWGGRYSSIIAVDADRPDSLTKFRLSELRPDFVYGVGVNDERWASFVHSACQPRRYAPLVPSIAEDVRKAQFEEFIHADRAVIAMFEARNSRARFNRTLKAVSIDVSSPYASFCAAVFGVHHPNLADQYRDEHVTFTSVDPVDFVELCEDFVEHWKLSWLDATGFGLVTHHMMTSPLQPTILLVDNTVLDLAYFWNLRLASESFYPPWIIPVPFNRAKDPSVQNGSYLRGRLVFGLLGVEAGRGRRDDQPLSGMPASVSPVVSVLRRHPCFPSVFHGPLHREVRTAADV